MQIHRPFDDRNNLIFSDRSQSTHHIKSLQWPQNTGCLKNFLRNLWSENRVVKKGVWISQWEGRVHLYYPIRNFLPNNSNPVPCIILKDLSLRAPALLHWWGGGGVVRGTIIQILVRYFVNGSHKVHWRGRVYASTKSLRHHLTRPNLL